MHSTTKHLGITITLVICALVLGADAGAATITGTTPNGGEFWSPGGTGTIIWTVTDLTGNVNIYLYNNWTKVRLLTTVPAGQGPYYWPIPQNEPMGNTYRIRVQLASVTTVSDYSDATFTISPPKSLTLTSPNGGESWDVADPHTITWTTTGLWGNANILLYNNWTKLGVLATVPIQSGSWSWDPDDTLVGPIYRIRIQSLADTSRSDYSDNLFTLTVISPQVIEVFTPFGGESWGRGTSQTISWESVGLWGNANIYLYNNWTKIGVIGTAPIQNGSWTWNIPAGQALGSAYRIRVQSLLNTAVSGYSNGLFEIAEYTGPQTILVFTPNGGESWPRGSAQTITWESTGLWGNAYILLYNNWTKLGLIGTTPIQNGSWSWNIPAGQALGSTYRIRVQSLLNTAVSGYSNGLFEIGGPGSMVSIPAGTFTMGNSGVGDDATYGGSDELPQHQVALGAYQIGKYEVTNQEYCDVLNWALALGYVENSTGGAYTGGDYVFAAGQALLFVTDPYCQVTYTGGQFVSATRQGFPMATHPVVMVTWAGGAVYCNWLSQKQGLTPCYNTSTWALNRAAGGYHLPTEAQWERAAAWDGSKHWIYGFASDTLTGKDRANYRDLDPGYVNPLGLLSLPCTSPVGWFDGINVSPNGTILTVNSASPAGCYDLSGNAWEWCHDYYGSYPSGTVSDPEGPATGSDRVIRGGCWEYNVVNCRTADRTDYWPLNTTFFMGFRLSRS